jgi:hypothetical protein
LLDSCAKTEVIAELDMISRRCNPVATSSNFAWYNLAMDDEVDVDDEEADEQPKNKQPRTTPWPCRLQALDLQNRFHFQTREVARKTLNIASLRDMKVTVPSLSDQRSAIRKVVRAFAWIDRIALETTSARKLVDHLDQAILTKAFRGELVPQDPKDEPVNVLPDRIRGGTGSSAINEALVDQEEMKGRLAKRPSHPSHLND